MFNLVVVTSCVPLEDINPACTEAECPNKPSYPSGISHVFYLNKTTKKLHLNISWGKPLFGKMILFLKLIAHQLLQTTGIYACKDVSFFKMIVKI